MKHYIYIVSISEVQLVFGHNLILLQHAVSNKMSRSFVVTLAITTLYLLNVEQTAIQWFWINRFFGMVGEAKDVAYAYTNTGPIWSYLVTNINGSLLATIADFLLVRIFTLRL